MYFVYHIAHLLILNLPKLGFTCQKPRHPFLGVARGVWILG